MTGRIPEAERLADDADRAAHHEGAFLARALQHQANVAAKPAQPWTPGVCRNCAEQPIAGVWCDDACRADYERRSRRGG